MNEDGTRLIIANSSYSYNNNNYSGRTLIYDFNSSTQKYTEVKKWDGTKSNNIGQSVSINSSGNIVAFISQRNHVEGGVSVFEFDGTNWISKGTIIRSGIQGFVLSDMIKLNDTGDKIIISEVTKSNLDQNRGSCFIFEFSNETQNWIQKGDRIFGPHRWSLFGKYNTEINSAGNIVMVGAYNTKVGKKGSVYLYYYSNYSNKWHLLHQENGSVQSELVGYKGFSMNNDGSKIAIAFQNKTKVYLLDTKYVEDSTSYTIEELHSNLPKTFIQYQYNQSLVIKHAKNNNEVNYVFSPYRDVNMVISKSEHIVTTDVNNNQYRGEWIQVQFPSENYMGPVLNPNSFLIYTRNGYTFREFCVLGSLDGENWEYLNTFVNYQVGRRWKRWKYSNGFKYDTDKVYSYFRVVFTKLTSSQAILKKFRISGMLNTQYNYPTPEIVNNNTSSSQDNTSSSSETSNPTVEETEKTLRSDPPNAIYTKIYTKIGTSNNQLLGYVSDISDDGTKIIYGNASAKKVYIGTYNSSTQTYNTPQEILYLNQTNFGKFVSMSGDGNTIAVGNWNASSNSSGKIWIYKLIDGIHMATWTIQNSGNSYSFLNARFNYDGSRMILGSYKRKRVEIYYYENGSYENKHTYAVGTGTGNFVDMNHDGTVIAFNYASSSTYIYECGIGSETWTQIGTIAEMRRGMSLSKDGYTILTSKYQDKAQIWTYSGSGTTWNQKGGNIIPTSNQGGFHNNNVISNDGNVVIFAEKWWDITGKTDCGRIRIYYYDASTDNWINTKNIEGEIAYELLGSYSINATGDLSKIIVGGYYGTKGTLRVYETDLYE